MAGLLESAYEALLAHELELRGLSTQRQVRVPVCYAGVTLDEGFRADLIVERKVIVELKSVVAVHPAHQKQLLTYLKLSGMRLGYLLNFGEALMKNGITRTIHADLKAAPKTEARRLR